MRAGGGDGYGRPPLLLPLTAQSLLLRLDSVGNQISYPFGHYARLDVFRLEVNEQPMKLVTFRERTEHHE